MTSRFISSGAIDASTGETLPSTSSPSAPISRAQQHRLDEWESVQRDLAAERAAREEARRAAGEPGTGEKSLYETLQANKAARQAEFEEKSKVRNQFRGIDEDEVEWLEGVREGQRGEEERVRRETEAGLEAFREARKEEEKSKVDDGDAGAEIWAVGGKKRKRRDDKGGLKGIKRRMSANERAEVGSRTTEAGAGAAKTEADKSAEPARKETQVQDGTLAEDKAAVKPSPAIQKAKPAMGLVAYGSDDDDDDDD